MARMACLWLGDGSRDSYTPTPGPTVADLHRQRILGELGTPPTGAALIVRRGHGGGHVVALVFDRERPACATYADAAICHLPSSWLPGGSPASVVCEELGSTGTEREASDES